MKIVFLISFFILIASSSILIGCKKSKVIPASGQQYSIEGTVVNSKDFSFVSGAKVFTIPATQSVVTDSVGHFAITNLDSGNYILVVEHNGFIKYSGNISVTKNIQVSVTLTESSLSFHAGVTFNFWFQANSASQLNFGLYNKQDFINAQELGCDVVRLPINLNFMTDGAPDFKLNPIFLNLLDQVVSWAEELHIYLILDDHSYYANGLPSNIGPLLVKVWGQMAKHYKSYSNYILYEVLNEPHGISNSDWGQIQREVIDTILNEDGNHTIIVDPNNFCSYNNLLSCYNNLKDLPNADKLVYDFHFYDPMVFTHQGASFINPPLTSLTGVPFPYNQNQMPPFPSDLDGTFFQWQFQNYDSLGTISYLKQLLDVAVSFKNSTGAKIYCGEFGVLNTAPPNGRILWYQTVRSYLQANNIPFTIWDYKDVFGLFNKGSAANFPADLNIPLLRALNFDVPQ